uniref:39S ribosomal protein L1, mitochondrial n=1 Tax=Dracunculus medinensis TaxID=318479 RepID=A0A0N4UFM4_DRAME
LMRFLRAILGSIGSTAPLIASTAKISKLLSPPILRNLKRTLSKQEKQEIRLRLEAREAARKLKSYANRAKMLSISMRYPGRYVKESENHLPSQAATNIIIDSRVKTHFYTIVEALDLLRQLQQPSIYNNKNARLRLRIELNMETERATKPVKDSSELVPVPYKFEMNEKRAILAFVKNVALQEYAVEHGAEMAFGPDIIKKIIKGQFRVDDYDFCVAHTDMAVHILPLRGILKSRFPTKINGGLGEDLGPIIEMFKNGVKLDIITDTVYPKWGIVDTVIGRLQMLNEEIEANIKAVVKATCKHRNPALGLFINRAVLMATPGDAYFSINIDHFCPVPTAEDIAVIEKRKNKKTKRSQSEVVQNDTSTSQSKTSDIEMMRTEVELAG